MLELDRPLFDIVLEMETIDAQDVACAIEVQGDDITWVRSSTTVGRRLDEVCYAHNPARPLIIDPVVVFSACRGPDVTGDVGGLAVDAAGNLYIATGPGVNKTGSDWLYSSLFDLYPLKRVWNHVR
jgi:hypothetical protein